MKKWIVLLIFFTFTYCEFRYKFEKPYNRPYLFTSISTNFLIKNKLGYLYREENKSISPKDISLKKINLLGFSTIIYNNKNPLLTSDKSREVFFLIPFWIKKITIESNIEVDNKEIFLEQSYTPYLEFGIRPFWAFIPVFEYAKPIVIFKIGENQ